MSILSKPVNFSFNVKNDKQNDFIESSKKHNIDKALDRASKFEKKYKEK